MTRMLRDSSPVQFTFQSAFIVTDGLSALLQDFWPQTAHRVEQRTADRSLGT